MTRQCLLKHVEVRSRGIEAFAGVLDEPELQQLRETASRARERLSGRVVWSVSSTMRGGGVAEMLRSLLTYARGAGIDARWAVIRDGAGFFETTKRLHNRLHGAVGDGGPLDIEARRAYEAVTAANARDLLAVLRPGDIVLLHDPQTAGMIPALRDSGAHLVWRCHIGSDAPNQHVREAWAFLTPYVQQADAYVFSRKAHVWETLDHARVTIVPPSIDIFSPKNETLSGQEVEAILRAAGILPGRPASAPTFVRLDGSAGRVDRRARMVEDAPVPPDAPLVVVVSRWDRLKDPVGTMRGFAADLSRLRGSHLLLAGPAVDGVADDPEGAVVLYEVEAARQALDAEARSRVHLASLPMLDADENGAIVNALQRRATVVVQKSLAEGFGLTVAEAMWKGRPVIGSRVGGIQDQIEDGVSGVLLDDATDAREFAAKLAALISDPQRGEQMGERAHRRVRDHYLAPRHLQQYLEIFESLLDTEPS